MHAAGRSSYTYIYIYTYTCCSHSYWTAEPRLQPEPSEPFAHGRTQLSSTGCLTGAGLLGPPVGGSPAAAAASKMHASDLAFDGTLHAERTKPYNMHSSISRIAGMLGACDPEPRLPCAPCASS